MVGQQKALSPSMFDDAAEIYLDARQTVPR